MNSSYHSCRNRKYSKNGCSKYGKFFGTKSEKTNKKCSSKECMAWREWIIERMGNKRSDSSYNFLRICSPCRKSKINSGIYRECEDNRKKYLECPNFPSIILFIYSCKPYTQKQKCSIDNYRFSENLDNIRIFWSYERASLYKELSIKLKKRFDHISIVLERNFLPRVFRRRDWQFIYIK